VALSVLYPAAFAYVAGKRISRFTREVSNQALIGRHFTIPTAQNP
jgi:hypothetical protein